MDGLAEYNNSGLDRSYFLSRVALVAIEHIIQVVVAGASRLIRHTCVVLLHGLIGS